jgi:carbamoyltransferase
MKPVLAIYEGHDCNVSVYDPKTDQIIVYELEKLFGHKHFNYKDYTSSIMHNCYRKILRHLKHWYDIDNDFEIVVYKNDAYAGLSIQEKEKIIKEKPLKFSADQTLFNTKEFYFTKVNHHDLHAWCGYLQSPFKKTAVLCWDGVGDDTAFRYVDIDDGKITYKRNRTNYMYSFVYEWFGRAFKSLEHTQNDLDVAGKMMALSAYGENDRDLVERIKDTIHTVDFSLVPVRQAEDHPLRMLKINIDDRIGLAGMIDKPGEDFKYSRAIQTVLQEDIVEILKDEYANHIRDNDNNLIITGGTALNILANEEIRKAFPDVDVYIPPNCNDVGLSVGMLAEFIDTTKKYNLNFAGPMLLDYKQMDSYLLERQHEIVTVQDIADMLKDNQIVGICQDNLEVGPRALGNRSILCNASNPKMKDRLNATVKFREWFRPFAPACRLEDAHKYFETTSFQHMDCMQFVAHVKEEYQAQLSSITHFDNTARLQVVTEENKRFYDILTAFDGVLINTSFNVQGKPILNSIQEALHVLDNTGLDAVIILHEGTYYKFT